MCETPISRHAPPPVGAEDGRARPRRRPSLWKRALKVLLVAPVLSLFMLPGRALERPPNILFVIMDDIGIDQMRSFGYGGLLPAPTPTIDRIARAGVRFRNTWSMPACTTSRSVFFTGRFPLRTNVLGALGPSDLANSHVSPFEVTVPKLLKERGYQSALFGKFHLGLQGNNPFGDSMVQSLGWDYFYGWLDETGDPSSIDTTAGGVAPPGTWSCGFVGGAREERGADTGACYAADSTCRNLSSSGPIPPGRTCRDAGGIFVPSLTCQDPPPALNFGTLSGHYVSPLVINHEGGAVERVPTTDVRARTFRGTAVVDAAIEWIQRQPAGNPWMATVSFASAHTPVMQPPPALLASRGVEPIPLDCRDALHQREITNQMIEAMDREIERLLVRTGLAHRGIDGQLVYNPNNSDTMLVIVGDNGSFGGAVKLPFDYTRAKGTAYQTGVWAPLIVAGPLVTQSNRDVRHMVNVADLYALFGEIAGIDVSKSVPRPTDAAPVLPYLTHPNQPSIRQVNFTQVGPNLQVNRSINGPCTIGTTCTQIPVTKEVCEDNGGTWWGADATAPETQGIPSEGLTRCCEVDAFLGRAAFSIQPLTSIGARNDHYKIVRNFLDDYDAASNSCVSKQTDEFYAIDEAVPVPTIDTAARELNSQGDLTPTQRANHRALSRELDRILTSQPECPGDGNADGVVDQRDLANWAFFAAPERGKSSWYDFTLDGLTDSADLQIIRSNLGKKCPKKS